MNPEYECDCPQCYPNRPLSLNELKFKQEMLERDLERQALRDMEAYYGEKYPRTCQGCGKPFYWYPAFEADDNWCIDCLQTMYAEHLETTDQELTDDQN